jgi:hypothetical protein
MRDWDIEQIERISERDRVQVKDVSDKGGHAPIIRQALYCARPDCPSHDRISKKILAFTTAR